MPTTNRSPAIPACGFSFATPEIIATPAYAAALAAERELARDFPRLFGSTAHECVVDEAYDRAGTPGRACTMCSSAWPADEPEAHGRGCRADRAERFERVAKVWDEAGFYGWADNYRAAVRAVAR